MQFDRGIDTKKQIFMISIICMLISTCFTINPVLGKELSITVSGGNTGNTLYVGGSGPGNYTTIQDAIDNASADDTVFVYHGIYYENVFINKSIQLEGEQFGIDGTVIHGTGIPNFHCISINSTNVTIKNLCLENATYSGIFISFNSDGTKVFDCNLKENNNGYGIYVAKSLDITIKNCSFVKNGEGISFSESNKSLVQGCSFRDNKAAGIYFSQSNNNSVVDCSMTSGYWGIVLDYLDCDNKIKNCTISDTEQAILVSRYSSNNSIDNCLITENNYGIVIFNNSNSNYIINSKISDNQVGVTCKLSDIGNRIYHNRFLNNKVQAIGALNNTWDDGYPSGGNYWSNYQGTDRYSGPGQNITGSDGIGDDPYMSFDVIDNYPLVDLDTMPPHVSIDSPAYGLYIGNHLIREFKLLWRIPLIIGPITIKINATDYGSGVERVEIFIDGQSRANLTDIFTYPWRHEKVSLFKHKHTIKVVAYDYAGNSASDKITVRKFW